MPVEESEGDRGACGADAPVERADALVRRGAFVAWIGYSRRGQLLARAFDLSLETVSLPRRPRFLTPLRYLRLGAATLVRLQRARPPVVFVQNPPIFAALTVCLWARLSGAAFLVDSHTSALAGRTWRWSLPIHAWISRRALATLVTNRAHADLVASWRALALVVPDIPVGLPAGEPFAVAGRPSFAVASSYSTDEPLEEIFEAARSRPGMRFYVTGDPADAPPGLMEQRPDNVEITGFLPDARYLGLLRAVDGVIALTRRENTMQRGGCEALALGQPLITSDTALLRDFFRAGTIHVSSSPVSIGEAVDRLPGERERLAAEMRELSSTYQEAWRVGRRRLQELMDAAAGR